VYYVPPLSAYRLRPDGAPDESQRRVPLEYLESLFGPEVRRAIGTLEAELAKRRRGEASELLDTLIAYRWTEMLGPFRRDPAEIEWQ